LLLGGDATFIEIVVFLLFVKIRFQKRWDSMEGVEEDNRCLALVYICGYTITCISNICWLRFCCTHTYGSCSKNLNWCTWNLIRHALLEDDDEWVRWSSSSSFSKISEKKTPDFEIDVILKTFVNDIFRRNTM